MLTLYYKPTCPYSQRVLGEAELLNISFRLKDIRDEVLCEELIAVGGRKQTPCLVDEVRGLTMYESQDIIDYLYEYYADGTGKQTFGGLRIHDSDETCESCQ